MEIIYKPEQKTLNKLAADILCRKTGKMLKDKEYVLWALPGGRSIGQVLEILSSHSELEWSRIHFFMTDERLVPLDDINSNFRLILEKLIFPMMAKRIIGSENIHPFVFSPESKDSGLGIYKESLIRLQDFYDIVLLSSGEDGHIAGLFPEHSTIRDDSGFYIKTDDAPKPPPRRMSSSRKLLARSKAAILLFYGPEKRQAYYRFMERKQPLEKCPARLVQDLKESFILTDQK